MIKKLDIKKPHKMKGTMLHTRWLNMRTRCFNPKYKSYHRYGGRGITVCKRWNLFANFYNDMVDGFHPDLELDRTDNNKGYTPSNCRWVDKMQQRQNMSTNVKYKGECASEASRRLGGCSALVGTRMRLYGWSKKEAFTRPARPMKKHAKENSTTE